MFALDPAAPIRRSEQRRSLRSPKDTPGVAAGHRVSSDLSPPASGVQVGSELRSLPLHQPVTFASVSKVARRLAIAIASAIVAWVAIALAAIWLFGSGNILVYVFAAIVGLGVYLAMSWHDRRTSPTK